MINDVEVYQLCLQQTMRYIAVAGNPYAKARTTLACGHTVVCDMGVKVAAGSPCDMLLPCPYCTAERKKEQRA